MQLWWSLNMAGVSCRSARPTIPEERMFLMSFESKCWQLHNAKIWLLLKPDCNESWFTIFFSKPKAVSLPPGKLPKPSVRQDLARCLLHWESLLIYTSCNYYAGIKYHHLFLSEVNATKGPKAPQGISLNFRDDKVDYSPYFVSVIVMLSSVLLGWSNTAGNS